MTWSSFRNLQGVELQYLQAYGHEDPIMHTTNEEQLNGLVEPNVDPQVLASSSQSVKLPLKHSVIVVFIANEENSSITGIGVDGFVKDGLLESSRQDPCFG